MNPHEIAAGRQRWQERYDAATKRDADFTTLSGLEVDPVYGPAEGDAVEDFERIGWPGEYPYTRGLYATGYRGKPWTIRQFAGFGNARQTNERYKMILASGGNGLSVAFDMPTLMGRDNDGSGAPNRTDFRTGFRFRTLLTEKVPLPLEDQVLSNLDLPCARGTFLVSHADHGQTTRGSGSDRVRTAEGGSKQ